MTEPSQQLTPCPHMKRALESLAQGKRGGIYLWYARLHTLKCNRCRAALEALKKYFAQVKSPLPVGEIDLDKFREGLRSADRER